MHNMKRPALKTANTAALLTAASTTFLMFAARGTDFAGYGTGILAVLVFCVGALATVIAFVVAAVRDESGGWFYLLPFGYLSLPFALVYLFPS